MKQKTYVYILNKQGKPLMPTTRCGKVRKLLKEGKAVVVRSNPFTIRLKYDTTNIVQDLYLGIDTGRENIGVGISDTKGNKKKKFKYCRRIESGSTPYVGKDLLLI